MEFNKRNLNLFLFTKLPSAWWSGVRVTKIDEVQCIASVKHRWFNQNPFNSMYFAVQAMAAELTTGVLVMREIRKSGHKISMLVAKNKSEFTKKAKGRIVFSCDEIEKVHSAISSAVQTKEGQTFWLTSCGTDEKGDLVSNFSFEWTVKIKA